MKKIKDIVVIIGIVGVLVLAWCYLGVAKEKNTIERERIEIAKQSKLEEEKKYCNLLGREKYNVELQEARDMGKVGIFGYPLYIYNQKLKKCFYENSLVDGETMTSYIYDLNTNAWMADSNDKDSESRDEFNKESMRLMNEESGD